MELLLVRHAAAEERDAARWPDDSDRPLTVRGRRRFERMLESIGAALPTIDLQLSSGYERAWATAAMLHALVGAPAPRRCAALEEAGAEAMLASLAEESRRLAHAACVAMVGHEPSIGETAALLLGAPSGSTPLKKGAICRIDLPGGARRGGGVLRFVVHPKLLGP